MKNVASSFYLADSLECVFIVIVDISPIIECVIVLPVGTFAVSEDDEKIVLVFIVKAQKLLQAIGDK